MKSTLSAIIISSSMFSNNPTIDVQSNVLSNQQAWYSVKPIDFDARYELLYTSGYKRQYIC